jgi:hypothetical protein
MYLPAIDFGNRDTEKKHTKKGRKKRKNLKKREKILE